MNITDKNSRFLNLVGEIVGKFDFFQEEEVSIIVKIKEERYRKILEEMDLAGVTEKSFKISVDNVELIFLSYT